MYISSKYRNFKRQFIFYNRNYKIFSVITLYCINFSAMVREITGQTSFSQSHEWRPGNGVVKLYFLRTLKGKEIVLPLFL